MEHKKFIPSKKHLIQQEFEKACCKGNFEVVKKIICQNKNINKNTGLYLSYKAEHKNITRYLLEDHKIDITNIFHDICINDELEILGKLEDRDCENNISKIVLCAIKVGNDNITKRLITLYNPRIYFEYIYITQ